MVEPGRCEVCDNPNAPGLTECAWCETTLPAPISTLPPRKSPPAPAPWGDLKPVRTPDPWADFRPPYDPPAARTPPHDPWADVAPGPAPAARGPVPPPRVSGTARVPPFTMLPPDRPERPPFLPAGAFVLLLAVTALVLGIAFAR